MRVAFLTAGGIAPCLSATIGRLIHNYSKIDPSIEMLGYLNGYKGLLIGNSMEITSDVIPIDFPVNKPLYPLRYPNISIDGSIFE